MQTEVIVVGAGIGGLTTAALLAARGVSVCVFERQPYVGGCLAEFEHGGLRFEPAFGIYGGWEPGGIFEQIFAEVSAAAPAVRTLSPAYAVRMPDGTEITVSADQDEFEAQLRSAFPECAREALEFYRAIAHPRVGQALVSTLLTQSASKFQRFVDSQLQMFAQCTIEQCSLEFAAAILNPQRRLYSLEEGGQALARTLANALQHHGGKLRLNAPVLRLAFGSDGLPVGVDLLSGEQVIATRAIVSNLTIWDTYGKLIGPTRTPRDVSSQLKRLSAPAAYLLFAGMQATAAAGLKARRLLALDNSSDNSLDAVQRQFFFSAGERATNGQVPVTVTVFTGAEDWFSFHADQTVCEERDQQMLESTWSRLHAALPELGDSIEVFETLTPQTYYETTRRRFGMVGTPRTDRGESLTQRIASPFPNLFLVGDTVSAKPGVDHVSESARRVADFITGKSPPLPA